MTLTFHLARGGAPDEGASTPSTIDSRYTEAGIRVHGGRVQSLCKSRIMRPRGADEGEAWKSRSLHTASISQTSASGGPIRRSGSGRRPSPSCATSSTARDAWSPPATCCARSGQTSRSATPCRGSASARFARRSETTRAGRGMSKHGWVEAIGSWLRCTRRSTRERLPTRRHRERPSSAAMRSGRASRPPWHACGRDGGRSSSSRGSRASARPPWSRRSWRQSPLRRGSASASAWSSMVAGIRISR
jgi:hypothetical protein